MKITEVTVSAGRTFNHPYEDYSNLKPHITLKASVEEGDDPEKCILDLQSKAERMVEDHKNSLLKGLREIESMRSAMQEIASLENSMRNAQEKLKELRENYPEQAQNLLTGNAPAEDEGSRA